MMKMDYEIYCAVSENRDSKLWEIKAKASPRLPLP
jgi:hypothetical protein